MVEIHRRPLTCHGTDHDSKPLSSFPRFCLPTRPLQCRQEEYRSGGATALGFDRSLLALPFASAGLHPARRAALRLARVEEVALAAAQTRRESENGTALP